MPAIDPTRRDFARIGAAAAVAQASHARAAQNPEIAKAMEATLAAIPTAASDPARPVYHFHPPANWNNDPNGTTWYQGWHHLFYQFNPYAAAWGHMHWGHARSRDLVNWEHLPIALAPSLKKGELHVFSGAAIPGPDGRPRLFYTSIGNRDPEQWMALPADDGLFTWKKYPGNPVLTLSIHGNRKISDWRDPFLFQEGGKTYMVCGGNSTARRTGGGGEVQLYEAVTNDFTRWRYRGPVFEYHDREAINIECPNLFKLGARWVLLISPHKPCEYFVGHLDLVHAKFVPEMRGTLDPGGAYASNISFHPAPRCLLWLWGKTESAPGSGWDNCMVLPRVLSIGADGYLCQTPAPEFEALRGEARTSAPVTLANQSIALPEKFSGDCLELEAELDTGDAAAVGLRLRCPTAGGAGTQVSYAPKDGMITAGTVRKLVGTGRRIRLRVFLDKRVMEVYVNDGAAAIFTVTGAAPDALGIEVFAKGGAARLESLTLWPLKPAKFSLDRFKV
ncbi:MAG: glycoside hydrolase family 32 protein [Bryobacteraceae bacterium]